MLGAPLVPPAAERPRDLGKSPVPLHMHGMYGVPKKWKAGTPNLLCWWACSETTVDSSPRQMMAGGAGKRAMPFPVLMPDGRRHQGGPASARSGVIGSPWPILDAFLPSLAWPLKRTSKRWRSRACTICERVSLFCPRPRRTRSRPCPCPTTRRCVPRFSSFQRHDVAAHTGTEPTHGTESISNFTGSVP